MIWITAPHLSAFRFQVTSVQWELFDSWCCVMWRLSLCLIRSTTELNSSCQSDRPPADPAGGDPFAPTVRYWHTSVVDWLKWNTEERSDAGSDTCVLSCLSRPAGGRSCADRRALNQKFHNQGLEAGKWCLTPWVCWTHAHDYCYCHCYYCYCYYCYYY